MDAATTDSPSALAPVERQAVAVREEPMLPATLAQAAIDPRVDPDKLERMWTLHERMEDRHAEREFNRAFVAMQAELPRIKKNGELSYPVNKNDPDGPKRKIANFARWEDIDEAIRPILTRHGFAMSFNITPRQADGGGLLVSTILRHEGGHTYTSDPFPVPLDTSGGKNNAQAGGSAASYGKRYSSSATLNLVYEGEDDDAQKAGATTTDEPTGITEAQGMEIEALLLKTKTDRKEVFAKCGVENLLQLTPLQHTQVVNGLTKKMKAMEAATP